MTQEELEAQILKKLLTGDFPVLRTLRAQLERSTVARREFTGVGFFTWFSVPSDTPIAQPPQFQLTDLFFELKTTVHGGGVVLFIENGRLDNLEAYLFADSWPSEPDLVRLDYLRVRERLPTGGATLDRSPERDWDQLKRDLSMAPDGAA